MVAHVGDFGLVKFLFEASDNPSKTQTLSIGLRGSIGYIPPEYGMGGEISTLGDIFSYGILLLEMFTGKKPIDEMFIDGLSIHKFTSMALAEHKKNELVYTYAASAIVIAFQVKDLSILCVSSQPAAMQARIIGSFGLAQI
ncbi:hypothetical protein CMV_017938 [Castanea mollissima]|uniref:Protein kinase domain-containing protein n=1 Tax=Castanea mollissima TaxID=60419 RepID=A0A8J4VD61_9ROSI|nr:hypothetical protein CMV_017938 [Castanea mollissima]KAF3956998.1 hypothetical protein CMV_017938 [Castanea mollissima]